MKHISSFCIFSLIFSALFFTIKSEQSDYFHQKAYLTNVHRDNNHPNVHFSVQYQPHAIDCTIHSLAQKHYIAVIKKFINSYFKEKDIPYLQLPASHCSQKISQSVAATPSQEIITPTILQSLYTPTIISHLEDALFIQEQCSEWEKHSDILHARMLLQLPKELLFRLLIRTFT